MTKHSPGPWQSEDDGCQVYSSDSNHTGIATMRVIGSALGGKTTSKANARLIAAAPELLAACEMALQFERPCAFSKGIDDVEYHQLRDGTLGATREECWKCRCFAAIAKATGTTIS